jgi:3-hydroxyisobutyrate dehydrogenase-like beta-hydroxyacid dehydrogenase
MLCLDTAAPCGKAAFDQVRPVLDDLGENVIHLGALGSGNTTKLISKLIAMTTVNAMATALLHSGMMELVKTFGVDGRGDAMTPQLVDAFANRFAG